MLGKFVAEAHGDVHVTRAFQIEIAYQQDHSVPSSNRVSQRSAITFQSNLILAATIMVLRRSSRYPRSPRSSEVIRSTNGAWACRPASLRPAAALLLLHEEGVFLAPVVTGK